MDRARARRKARHRSSRAVGGGIRRPRQISRILPAPIRCPRRRYSAGLGSGSVRDSARDWLTQARSLGSEIGRVDDALRQAEESAKLNPRSLRLPHRTTTLRESLETLEHAAVTLRVFARSLVDSTRLADDNPLADPDVRRRMADVLRELSAAVRTYGSLATEFDASSHDLLESELERHLAAVHDDQDRLSELLGTDPAARPTGWLLRGELISHLDRFRTELEAGKPDSRPRRRRNRAWRLPHARLQRLPPAWRRLIN
jgi:hypothetical protein